jgi:hypothetical protein
LVNPGFFKSLCSWRPSKGCLAQGFSYELVSKFVPVGYWFLGLHDPDCDRDHDPDPDHDHDRDPDPDPDHDSDHDPDLDPNLHFDPDPDPDHDPDPDPDTDHDHALDLYLCLNALIYLSTPKLSIEEVCT